MAKYSLLLLVLLLTASVGGLGNLLCMAQAGHLSHADTVDNLTLLATEVMPRLKAYKQPQAVVAA